MKKLFMIYMAVCICFSGCDILDEDPQTQLTPKGYYDTKEGIETLVNACYSRLRYVTASDVYLLRLTEQGTDIFESGLDGSINFDSYRISLTAGEITRLWEDCYIGINGCNTLTAYLPAVADMTGPEKIIREAEVRFLRAYMYYHLIMQFGDVHLTLEPTEGVETEANRTSVAQILDEAIYPDLRYAVANLPLLQSDYGRVDVHGARFFLSYVLLSDSRSGKAQFDEAAGLAVNVIENSPYALQENRFLVYDQDNDMNNEIIWSFQFSQDESLRENGNKTHLYFVPQYQNSPGMTRVIEYGRSFTRFKPTQFMCDLYDPDIDARYQAYWRDTWYTVVETENLSLGDTAIYMPQKAWTKEQIDAQKYRVYNPEFSENYGDGYFRTNNQVFWQLRKFDDVKRPTMNEEKGTRDWVCFRVAEAYLLAGEAYYRSGDNGNAVKYINILRRNAAVPGKESDMEITAADLSIDFILDERARELCGEGKRWYDLKRLDKLLERAMKHNPLASVNMKPYHVLRPIPQSQIDRCSNLYPQNEGW
ncbi:MAG: RagB/SusD family nutrient uptake outer membrane protein [Tannerellaceae bacterium]|nr:RagB/SusD family nutrient uptake outer membrane protein [Tannerellaceae bacterium]